MGIRSRVWLLGGLAEFLTGFCFTTPLENFDCRGAMFPLALVPKFSPVIVTSTVFQHRGKGFISLQNGFMLSGGGLDDWNGVLVYVVVWL